MGKYNDFKNDHAVVAVAGIATDNSPALNVLAMEQVIAILTVGTITTGTIDAVIEDSADGATGWATVPGCTFTQIADAGSDTTVCGTLKVNTGTVKQYVRLAVTKGGTTASYGGVLIAKNLSGHLPLTVGALPAPDFAVNEPT
jgi:hypothetical protein